MTTKIWNFTIEGQTHTLTLDHGAFSGKRSITLDGDLLDYIPRNLIDSGGVHEYQINGHSVAVIIQSKLTGFSYDLLVDGISLTTGEQPLQRKGSTPLQATLFFAAILFIFGIVISWTIVRDYKEQLVIQEWPVVTGNIVAISTDYHPDNDDDDGDSSYYHAILTVEYIVGNSKYTSEVDDDQSFSSERQAKTARILGDNQALYVNPSNPIQSHLYFEKLEPYGWIWPVLIVFGMVILMSAMIVGVTWYRTR